MEKTIKVIGTGTAESRPDTIEIQVDFETLSTIYETSMNDNNRKVHVLVEGLKALGLPKSSAKTGQYRIERTSESYQDANKNHRSRFVGYTTRQAMTLRFDLDLDLLNKVLTLLGTCEIDTDFQIRFTLKDPQALQEEILRSAALRAKRQATILVETSGCRLGELLSIDYSWSKINVYSDMEYSLTDRMMATQSMTSAEFEPEDVKASDTVTFIWSLA